jgi:glycosyltransferase involved in cell wall biosynthesis
MKELYHKAFNEYEHILTSELVPISKEERNQDLIFVFTTQFLSERHAPTRTTLERCYTLGKLLGKRILLINTREQYTRKGDVMIHQPTYGNVIKNFDTKTFYEYKDLKIPFYQPSVDMPDLNVILQLLKKVREAKPWMIFTIGNGSIAADLCGRLVPEAAISVAFSKLATTKATFSVIGRKIAEDEWKGLLQQGYSKDNIIESTFTFELTPKVKSITRDDYKIPKDRFVLITIGIRLDTEIQDDFIQMLQATFTYGTHIVFAGYFDRYQEYCTKYPEFAKNSTFVGYSKDILALMEICDLYVNPRRLGGGFSIIEAFHEGKPGVTTAYGDIAVAAGRDFCVQDYTEMIETIRRYKEDKEFYNTMAEKAKAREKVVTDSALSMRNIMKSIQESPLFF